MKKNSDEIREQNQDWLDFKKLVPTEISNFIAEESKWAFCLPHAISFAKFTKQTAVLKSLHKDVYFAEIEKFEQKHGITWDDIGIRMKGVSLLQGFNFRSYEFYLFSDITFMNDAKKSNNDVDPYQEILDSPDAPFSLRWRIVKEIDRSNSFYLVFNLFMYQWRKHISKLSFTVNDKVKVLEVGPGSGTLALKVLQWMHGRGLNLEYFLYDSQSDILDECYKRF